MKLSERSYPHPVVGNRDDVPKATFQTTIEMSTDKENIYVDVKVISNSKTIETLVNEGKATYLLHIECSNTFFREAHAFSEASIKHSIVSENLNDFVEVNVFVVAKQKNLQLYGFGKPP